MVVYRQLDDTIFTDDTSRRGPLVVDAAEPEVPVAVVVEDDDMEECSFQSVRPVTWMVWPTCRSRSEPPSSFQVPAELALFDAPVVVAGELGSAAVVPTLLLPVVPVVPAVVVVGFVAPDAVVVDDELALDLSSTRASLSMNAPSLPRARQPVTVT